MRYSVKIFISIVIVLGIGFWFYGYWLMKEIHTQYSIAIEGRLVDISNVMASYLSTQVKDGVLNTTEFGQSFKNLKKISFQSKMHVVLKGSSPINAYVTDKMGIILYDSRSETNIGSDFSRWNDVFLTLKGQYGARSTRTNINDPLSSVYFVAAPIKHKDQLIGVVSVIKSEKSLKAFFEKSKKKLILIAVLVLFVATMVAALISYWLTRPVESLIKYAKKVAQNESIHPPKTSSIEFNELGQALDKMRISLEGKKSVVNFVQHLTHELKSPLSAIQGAAELLRDDMPKEKKELFISNIETEANRARKQLDELLTLSSLESRSSLINAQNFSLGGIFDEAKQSLYSLIEKKQIDLELILNFPEILVSGERSLFLQTMNSLLLNAIEFSPDKGKIQIEAFKDENNISIFVRDQGLGIPDYAKERIFEKFYSLERPSTGKKSTGLGLNFVKEAVSLHSGSISLVPPKGTMLGANFMILLSN